VVEFPLKVEHAVFEATHPDPLVLHPAKNSLHSRSVVAVELWVQALLIQADGVEAVDVDQQGVLPAPVKVLH
jgi:hypothetical protein